MSSSLDLQGFKGQRYGTVSKIVPRNKELSVAQNVETL